MCSRCMPERLRVLQAESPGKAVMLRVEVEGGGCSGFQYKFKLDSAAASDDTCACALPAWLPPGADAAVRAALQ